MTCLRLVTFTALLAGAAVLAYHTAGKQEENKLSIIGQVDIRIGYCLDGELPDAAEIDLFDND